MDCRIFKWSFSFRIIKFKQKVISYHVEFALTYQFISFPTSCLILYVQYLRVNKEMYCRPYPTLIAHTKPETNLKLKS